jgi:hypothetical protein
MVQKHGRLSASARGSGPRLSEADLFRQCAQEVARSSSNATRQEEKDALQTAGSNRQTLSLLGVIPCIKALTLRGARRPVLLLGTSTGTLGKLAGPPIVPRGGNKNSSQVRFGVFVESYSNEIRDQGGVSKGSKGA